MGHYSDYYAAEREKNNKWRKEELLTALKKLEQLSYWNPETRYILPQSVRDDLEKVIRNIKAELYDLET